MRSPDDARVHGEMTLRFNPFCGFTATAAQASQFRDRDVIGGVGDGRGVLALP